MTDSLPEELMRLVHQVGLHTRSAMADVVAEYDLSPQLAWTMRELAGGPKSMGELADNLCCDASYITGLADRLERRGLAERRADPEDRRIRQLVLTEDGQSLLERVSARIHQANPLLHSLDPEDLRTLVEILKRASVPSPTER